MPAKLPVGKRVIDRRTGNLIGRPSLFSKNFIKLMEEKITPLNALALTEEELIFSLIQCLPEDERITVNTYFHWKENKKENPLYVKFKQLYETAKLNKKIGLIEKIEKGEPNWQSKAWLTERKFKDWNINNQYVNQGNIIFVIPQWFEKPKTTENKEADIK